ncbi:MAG: DNA double-strand break repair nuclease NurA [Candidatus Limnocylindrales bacterium]
MIAIDGSNAEVDVQTGYPGAKIGYCTVASVLVDLELLETLDEHRPVDPIRFRTVEQAASIDAALPGSNVVTRTLDSARESFRQTLHEVLSDAVVDEQDRTPLLTTYEELLAWKPAGQFGGQACPYELELGCQQRLSVRPGTTSCSCARSRAIFSTDALRIHEAFRDQGTNGEALGEVMQVWERLFLVHLLRCFERRALLGRIDRVAFVLDGPLAVFGHPAWLSAAISSELKRINVQVREKTGRDLLLIGVEKTGTFVSHFDDLDQRDESGTTLFDPRSVFMPDDQYIKSNIVFSTSPKRYGLDTYFGRKVFYKTLSGARLVVDIPFLNDEQDSLASSDLEPYSEIGTVCGLLDRLVSSRYPNALTSLVSANAQAAIPLNLGGKVLEQLARALMRHD